MYVSDVHSFQFKYFRESHVLNVWQGCQQYYYKCITRKAQLAVALVSPSKVLVLYFYFFFFMLRRKIHWLEKKVCLEGFCLLCEWDSSMKGRNLPLREQIFPFR